MGVYTTMRASGMSATARLVDRRRSSPASGCRMCLVRDPGLATSGTRGGPWLLVPLVAYGTGFGAAFSPLVTQALVHVPPAEAADVELWLAALTLLGVVGALLLARTVRDATRAAAG
jgi:hypothetical protein